MPSARRRLAQLATARRQFLETEPIRKNSARTSVLVPSSLKLLPFPLLEGGKAKSKSAQQKRSMQVRHVVALPHFNPEVVDDKSSECSSSGPVLQPSPRPINSSRRTASKWNCGSRSKRPPDRPSMPTPSGTRSAAMAIPIRDLGRPQLRDASCPLRRAGHRYRHQANHRPPRPVRHQALVGRLRFRPSATPVPTELTNTYKDGHMIDRGPVIGPAQVHGLAAQHDQGMGATIVQTEVARLGECLKSFDFVINCAVLGSRTLVSKDKPVAERPCRSFASVPTASTASSLTARDPTRWSASPPTQTTSRSEASFDEHQESLEVDDAHTTDILRPVLAHHPRCHLRPRPGARCRACATLSPNPRGGGSEANRDRRNNHRGCGCRRHHVVRLCEL